MKPKQNDLYNRELSWIGFNQRVLDEAMDPRNPLLERVKFLAISATNLDEFFMVRVGGLQIMLNEGSRKTSLDGLTAESQLRAISQRAHNMVRDQYSCYSRSLRPLLARKGIRLLDMSQITPEQQDPLEQFFLDAISPILSPIAIASDEPFPLLNDTGITLAVRLKPLPSDPEGEERFAILPVLPSIERFVRIPSHDEEDDLFLFVEDVIKHFIHHLFCGETILEMAVFRITRNADMRVREDLAPDLLTGMEEVLQQRKVSDCVRLEIERSASTGLVNTLKERLHIHDGQIYRITGPINLSALMHLADIEGYDELRNRPWEPLCPPEIDLKTSLIDQIARRDFLLCHPYDCYDPVVKLVEEASTDPGVLAIKQILYRTSRNSPIIRALKRAAEHGKYVTVVVELKARFDEARNIEWARELEYAGAQVVYGVKNLKTHAKVCLIVRREESGIVRYMHFGTGNYNDRTARLYSDISYMTCKEEYGLDASAFFNAITGYSQPSAFLKIAAAPINLRDRLLELIEGEIERTRQGQAGLIMAKVNSLVDPVLIRALYRASQAGVQIKLNVRGVCCLRPGDPKLSRRISVTSILDRYLEHSRIIYFLHGGEEPLFISSADWMPRNLDRRLELLVPVEDPESHQRLKSILETYFLDHVKARVILPDGSYQKPKRAGKGALSSQQMLYEQALQRVEHSRQMQRTVFEPHQAVEA